MTRQMLALAPQNETSFALRLCLVGGLLLCISLAKPVTAFAQDAPAGTKSEAAAKPPAAEKPPGSAEPFAEGLGRSLAEDPGTPVDPDAALKELGYEDPMDKVRDLLADPPGAKRLSKDSSLWIDVKQKRIYVDGYVAIRDGHLEMFACPAGTKEHESIVAALAKADEVHAALLAIGAQKGTTVKFQPKYVPATGQRIRVWVMYRDEAGKFQATDAKKWVREGQTDKSLDIDWVFGGSVTWTDPEDGKSYYQANSGELICVSNFGSAMMDLPVESSDSNASLSYMAYTDRIPPELTPVRLMMVPIPATDDKPSTTDAPVKPLAAAADPNKAPDESLMPLKKPASKSVQ